MRLSCPRNPDRNPNRLQPRNRRRPPPPPDSDSSSSSDSDSDSKARPKPIPLTVSRDKLKAVAVADPEGEEDDEDAPPQRIGGTGTSSSGAAAASASGDDGSGDGDTAVDTSARYCYLIVWPVSPGGTASDPIPMDRRLANADMLSRSKAAAIPIALPPSEVRFRKTAGAALGLDETALQSA